MGRWGARIYEAPIVEGPLKHRPFAGETCGIVLEAAQHRFRDRGMCLGPPPHWVPRRRSLRCAAAPPLARSRIPPVTGTRHNSRSRSPRCDGHKPGFAAPQPVLCPPPHHSALAQWWLCRLKTHSANPGAPGVLGYHQKLVGRAGQQVALASVACRRHWTPWGGGVDAAVSNRGAGVSTMPRPDAMKR